MSTFDQAQYVAAAVRFGAAGFLSKSAPLGELVTAIRVISRGGSIFTPEQLSRAFVCLTSKERAVLALAMEGLSNKAIGRRVGTTAKTVEGHLGDLYLKHQILGGRVELVQRAHAEGWLDIVPPGPGRSGKPQRTP